MVMITALCVRSDGPYPAMGVDCYTKDRDAFNFKGKNPVIAHPPCRAWGSYRHKSLHSQREKDLAIFCLDVVRRNGGVLEHPVKSVLWELLGPDDETLVIDQHWFGHPSQKRTRLLVSKVQLGQLPLNLSICRPVENLSRRQRELTPVQLASWLVDSIQKSYRTPSRPDEGRGVRL